MEDSSKYPYALDFSKRRAASRNLVWSLAFGAGDYSERQAAHECFLLRNGESPEFPTAPLVSAIWKGMAIAYVQKVEDGGRCLAQLIGKLGGLDGLKRMGGGVD